jgi:hypothetical protein
MKMTIELDLDKPEDKRTYNHYMNGDNYFKLLQEIMFFITKINEKLPGKNINNSDVIPYPFTKGQVKLFEAIRNSIYDLYLQYNGPVVIDDPDFKMPQARIEEYIENAYIKDDKN